MKTEEEIRAMLQSIIDEECDGDIDIGWQDALNWVLNNG